MCKSKTNNLPSLKLDIPIINLYPTKLKIKTFLPAELSSEIINFIPFNEKWAVTRISRLFDYFVFKLQKIWIIKLRIVSFQLNHKINCLMKLSWQEPNVSHLSHKSKMTLPV